MAYYQKTPGDARGYIVTVLQTVFSLKLLKFEVLLFQHQLLDYQTGFGMYSQEVIPGR